MYYFYNYVFYCAYGHLSEIKNDFYDYLSQIYFHVKDTLMSYKYSYCLKEFTQSSCSLTCRCSGDLLR